MRPLLIRWGTFTMQIPGEATLFLLAKVAWLLALLKH